MYHLIIENLGVKRCIARSDEDIFEDGMYADCSLDLGCIPNEYVRDISIICTGDKPFSITAGVYRD